MKSILHLGLVLLMFFAATAISSVQAGGEGKGAIQWYSIEEGLALSEQSNKKMIIDIYTDWCGWCKKLDKVTFSHPVVAEYINENFIPVKLDGEMKETVVLQGQEFKFIPKGRKGVHELANYLMKGNPTYPSVAFLDEKKEVITVQPGFLEPADMDKLLKFIGDDYYLKTPWPMFDRNYKSKIKKKSGK